MEGLFFFESFTRGFFYLHRVKKVIFEGKTKFQEVHIVDVDLFGRVLFLDRKIQSAEVDEFIYHESLVHPAMFIHPKPEKVLILGGGEGATLREVLKHRSVKKAVMVDIDGELVELCKKYLKSWHNGAFDDKRTELIIGDAYEYIHKTDEKFDVIISDLTEPLEEGPSIPLFSKESFTKMKEILTPGGIVVVQSGSADPVYPDFFASIYKTLSVVFKDVKPYWAFIFSFQMPWGFVIATDSNIPEEIEEKEIPELRYFSKGLYPAMFKLPIYLLRALEEKGKVITNESPFIWEA